MSLLQKNFIAKSPGSTTVAASAAVAGMISPYNVKNAPYNAKGDGVTLDADAINAAISSAAAAGGGIVDIPAGTYLCDKTVRVSGDGLILRGAGRLVAQLVATTANIVLLRIGTGLSSAKCSDQRVQDLGIVHISAAAYGSAGVRAVELMGANTVALRDCYINGGADCLYMKNVDQFEVHNNTIIPCTGGTSNTFHAVEGIQTGSGGNGDDVTIGKISRNKIDINTSGQVAMLWDHEGANSNEFNRIAVENNRIGNADVIGTLVKYIGGTRATKYDTNEFRYGSIQVDASQLGTGYIWRPKFICNSMIGNSGGNNVGSTFKIGNNTVELDLDKNHFAYTDKIFDIVSASATLTLNGNEATNTSCVFFVAGVAKPAIIENAPSNYSGSVLNIFNAAATANVTWRSLAGFVSTTMRTEVAGSANINPTSVATVVTWPGGVVLPIAPRPNQISLMVTNTGLGANIGSLVPTAITTSGMTINCMTTPVAASANIEYRVRL